MAEGWIAAERGVVVIPAGISKTGGASVLHASSLMMLIPVDVMVDVMTVAVTAAVAAAAAVITGGGHLLEVL